MRRFKGFSAIEAFVAVLLFAFLAVGGWYVLRKQHSSAPASRPAAAARQPSVGKPVTSDDPTAGGKYLVIKEWGVRFPLSQELQGDVMYGVRKNVLLNDKAPDGTPPVYGDVAYFASKKLEAIVAPSNNCGLKSGAYDDLNQRSDPASYDGGPGVSLGRSAQAPGPANDLGHEVGTYWYTASKGSAPACYAGSDGSQEQAFITATMDALRQVQAVP